MMVGSGGGNMLDRFVRVVNSNINRFISGIENPEKVIIQALDDMQVSGAETPPKDR
jgi:phage shock protein A